MATLAGRQKKPEARAQSAGGAPIASSLSRPGTGSKSLTLSGRMITQVGVSLAWLSDFAKKRVELDWTMQEVMERIVKPETRREDGNVRFVDLVPAEHCLPPAFFVSHMWSAKFHDLVNSLTTYATQHGLDLEKTGVWIDVFIIMQHTDHDGGADLNHDLAQLSSAIREAGKTLLVLDEEAKVLTRVWCLWELWQTIMARGEGGIEFIMHGSQSIGDAIFFFDSASANASVKTDLDRITLEIQDSIGHAKLTSVLKDAFINTAVKKLSEPVPEDDTARAGDDQAAAPPAVPAMQVKDVCTRAEPVFASFILLRAGGRSLEAMQMLRAFQDKEHLTESHLLPPPGEEDQAGLMAPPRSRCLAVVIEACVAAVLFDRGDVTGAERAIDSAERLVASLLLPGKNVDGAVDGVSAPLLSAACSLGYLLGIMRAAFAIARGAASATEGSAAAIAAGSTKRLGLAEDTSFTDARKDTMALVYDGVLVAQRERLLNQGDFGYASAKAAVDLVAPLPDFFNYIKPMSYSSVGASLLAQVEVALGGGDAAPSPDAVPRMLDEAEAALAKSLALFKEGGADRGFNTAWAADAGFNVAVVKLMRARWEQAQAKDADAAAATVKDLLQQSERLVSTAIATMTASSPHHPSLESFNKALAVIQAAVAAPGGEVPRLPVRPILILCPRIIIMCSQAW